MTLPIILSTGSLYNLDIDTIMAVAAETGFAGLEVVVDWRWETHRLTHLERLMSRHNMPILAVHSPFLNMPIQGWPHDPVSRIQHSVRLAEMLGAPIVVVHPPERWLRMQALVTAPTWTRKVSAPLPVAGVGKLGRWLWQDLAGFQAKTNVKIAVENMPCRPLGPLNLKPHHFFKPKQLNHFQYLTLDTTHVGACRENLLDFYQKISSKVAHIHLSNYNGQEHRLLNDGNLPLAAFLQALVADGYQGFISLELNTFDLQSEDECALRRNLRESLVFCQDILTSAQV